MCSKTVLLTLSLVSAFAVPSISYELKMRMNRQFGVPFPNFYGNIYNPNANTQNQINSIIANTQNAINQQVQNIFNQANFPFGNLSPNQPNYHNQHNQQYQHNHNFQHNPQNKFNNHHSQNNLNDNINNPTDNNNKNDDNGGTDEVVVWDDTEKMNPVGEDQYSIHKYVNGFPVILLKKQDIRK